MRVPLSLIVRSTIFNVAFYTLLITYMLFALPTFFTSRFGILRVAQFWGKTHVWLLKTICNIGVEYRGLENIPSGPLIVASKHQSVWETFAYLPLFNDPVFILKRELQWIPIFGWYTIKAQMIPVDRAAHAKALAKITAAAHDKFEEGRQLLIFPEGTRRSIYDPPHYKFGFSYIYEGGGVPCLPVALNSGLFWPRRTFLRYPGTVLVEFLPPVAPGMEKTQFFAEVTGAIEQASQRLLQEGLRDMAARGIEPPPPPRDEKPAASS